MRRFEFSEGSSNKFWQIDVSGNQFTVSYGRLGTAGKVQTKSWPSAAAAKNEADKLVKSKLAKGYREVAAPKAGQTPKAASATVDPTGPMSERVFWALMARLNWAKTGDDDAVIRPVVQALAQRPVADIFAFDDLLAEKLYALDTRDMAKGMYRDSVDPDDGDEYLSPDDFLYLRCVVVANGQKFFERVLKNPNKAPQEMEFEALLTVARVAYEEKTGDEYNHVTPVSWESFSNKKGWEPAAKTRAGRFTGQAVPPGNRRPS